MCAGSISPEEEAALPGKLVPVPQCPGRYHLELTCTDAEMQQYEEMRRKQEDPAV
jgi:hypothetical protein